MKEKPKIFIKKILVMKINQISQEHAITDELPKKHQKININNALDKVQFTIYYLN